MKNLRFFIIATLFFSLVKPALANRDVTGDDFDQLDEIMGFEKNSVFNDFDQNHKNLCNKTTEFTYKSPNLQSSNKQITVYFEVMLKRRPQPEQDENCFGMAETPLATMVIVQGEKTKKIKVEVPHGDSEFIIYKPISFSKNHKFILFTKTHIVPEPENEYVIFGLEKNSEKLVPLNCVFSDYRGFITETEVVFKCDYPISSEGMASDKRILLTFNLNSQKLTQRSIPPNTKYYSHGSLQGRYSLINMQVVEPNW